MSEQSTRDQAELGERTGQAIGRGLEAAFSIFVAIVFVVLWIYIAAAALGGDALLEDTWAWFESFGLIGRVMVGVLILPIIVFVWAWQANLEPWAFGLVMLGMVAWSVVAFQGIGKIAWRRIRR